MTDLVKQLEEDARVLEEPPGGFPTIAAECREAARLIEQLVAVLALLVSRLESDNAEMHRLNGVCAELAADKAELVAAVEAADMARTRLENFADMENSGQAQAGGRELKRRVKWPRMKLF